jgi:hypothetical protein
MVELMRRGIGKNVVVNQHDRCSMASSGENGRR